MQYTVQVAWVGARGILDDSTASILAGDTAQVPAPASTDPSTAPVGSAAPVPTWQGSSKAVNLSLYTHPSEHYLQWRGSDRSFREYVPIEGKPVCVAAMGVPPPPIASAVAGSHARGQTEPGLYLFTCRRPTAYICECEWLIGCGTRQSWGSACAAVAVASTLVRLKLCHFLRAGQFTW